MTTPLPACGSVVPHFRLAVAAALLMLVVSALPVEAQLHEWPADQSTDTITLRGSASPAERKLSFNLLLISRRARHVSVGGLSSAVDISGVAPDGTVAVEVTAYLSPSLMASPVMGKIVRANGAISLEAYVSDHLQVRLSQRQLLDLAANPNVLSIREIASVPPPNPVAAMHVPASLATR